MKRYFAAATLMMTLAPAVQAQDASTVLATVGGVDITLGHVIALEGRLPEQYRQLPDEVLFTGILEQLLQQEVLAAKARQTLSRAQALGLENEARTYLASSVLDDIERAEVSEADLKTAYEAQFATDAPKPEFNASHILVTTEEEAQALVAELAAGADFATLAQEKSTGPSGPNGGQLGWFGLGMMVPDFETAVLQLEPDQISAPVQTQFGWHVIRLNSKRQVGAPPLEDVREELTAALRDQQTKDVLQEMMNSADIVRVEVDIDPALIRNTDLLKD